MSETSTKNRSKGTANTNATADATTEAPPATRDKPRDQAHGTTQTANPGDEQNMASIAEDEPITVKLGNRARANSNASAPIDFSSGVDATTLDAQAAIAKGHWSQKLSQLSAGVATGAGDAGKFYLLGTFGNPAGARNVIRDFEKNPEKVPCLIELKSVIRPGIDGGKRTSELWAAIPTDSVGNAE